MGKNLEIKIKLLKVEETGFFLNSIVLKSLEENNSEDFNIEFGMQIQPQTEKNILILHLIIKYRHDKERFLELHTANSFEIENLEKLMIFEEKNIIDTHKVMPTLLGIAIGTLRGILVVKTSGTTLSAHPLPIINPTELCNNLFSKNKISDSL